MIEYAIIPYLYSKQSFKYNVNIGLFNYSYHMLTKLRNDGAVAFVSELLREHIRIHVPLYYLSNLRNFKVFQTTKTTTVRTRDVSIGKYVVDIYFHSVRSVKSVNGYHIKIHSNLVSISDISVAIIGCRDKDEDMDFANYIIPKLLSSSDDTYILVLDFGRNRDEMLENVHYILSEMKHMDISNIFSRVDVCDGKVTPSDMTKQINAAISEYIRRLEQNHRAL